MVVTGQRGRGLVLAGGVLALEAVEEAAEVVALLVAAAVVEEVPAGHAGGAVGPRPVPVERAVASVPLALVVVALVVADLVARVLGALQVGAERRADAHVLAVAARRVHGAAAAVLVRVGRVLDAGASVLAGERAPLRVLAVRAGEARLAVAEQVSGRGLHAAAAVLARQLDAAVVLYAAAVVPSEALENTTWLLMSHMYKGGLEALFIFF